MAQNLWTLVPGAGGVSWTVPPANFFQENKFAPASNASQNGWFFRAGGSNPGDVSRAIVRAAAGWAQENGDATRDRVDCVFNEASQGFQLTTNGNSDIVVPVLANGLVNFFGGVNNQSRFRLQVNSTLFRRDLGGPFNPVGPWVQVGGAQALDTGWLTNPGGAGNTTIDRALMSRFAGVSGDNAEFQVRTSLTLSAQADNNGVVGAAGTGVTFDFSAPQAATGNPQWGIDSRGVTLSVNAEPENYLNANSRAVVRAAYARAAYGVTGEDVKVGIIEPGLAKNHASFGVRFNPVTRAGPGTNIYESEHTTAVASIIASRTGANDEKRDGVAPGASLYSADTSEWGGAINAINGVLSEFGAGNAAVLNFSMKGGMAKAETLDQIINKNPNVTFVWAAGNDRLTQDNANYTYIGTVPNPNFAFNNIAVGALSTPFTKMADFSSNTQGTFPIKPDIVAPGEFILSASTRDLDNNATNDDFTRSFVADMWRRTLNASAARLPDTGNINGTSFAAPHVSGIIALTQDYANKHAADLDARAKDQKVMKATLLAGGRTSGVTDFGGLSWSQAKAGSLTYASPLKVTRSLDMSLGAGVADAAGMLQIYSQGEAHKADNNAAQNFKISVDTSLASGKTGFWDLETVAKKNGAIPGTVDYLLGGSTLVSDNIPQGVIAPITYLRVALTWNATTNGAGTTYNALDHLELRLFIDGLAADNMLGWDPAVGKQDAADYNIAFTENAQENVKLFDFDIQSLWFTGLDLPGLPGTGRAVGLTTNFYLQVINTGDNAVEYGIAASYIPIPTPGTLSVLVFGGVLASRRRRA